MGSFIKLFVIFVEWAVQWKRHDDQAKKQERLREARTDPANYLRQFGRVRRKPDESKAVMPDSGTSADKHDSQ